MNEQLMKYLAGKLYFQLHIHCTTKISHTSMCIKHPSRALSSQDEKLITHLHLVLTLRMGEAIHLLLIYTFMVWLRKILPTLPLY